MNDQDRFVPVAPEDTIDEGEMYPIDVDGEELLLTRVNGCIFAVHGICTHEYAQLWDGELEDETIWCPLHSSGFNVRTGEATNLPAVERLPTYDVRVEGEQVYVSRTPKVAEE